MILLSERNFNAINRFIKSALNQQDNIMSNYKESRPWGSFENILDEKNVKVKKIVINPDQAPSYQFHYKRKELWQIISGHGRFRVAGDNYKLSDRVRLIHDESFYHESINSDIESWYEIHPGDYIEIDRLTAHQIANTGKEPLVFIEIQTGEYFGEDDIVRLEDRYGRE